MRNESEITPSFEAAKENPKLRQAYLDSLLSQCPESVKKAVYDPEYKQGEQHLEKLRKEGHINKRIAKECKQAMVFCDLYVVMPHVLMGVKRKHPIFVTIEGIEKPKNQKQFLNQLIDHEAYHTQDLYKGICLNNELKIDYTNIRSIHPATMNAVWELRAHDNQFKQAIKKGIRDHDFLMNIQNYLDEKYLFFAGLIPQTNLEDMVKNYMLNNY